MSRDTVLNCSTPGDSMKYEVRYREVREGWFDVEAESEIDAYNKFWDMVGTGEIDLLRTDMTESDVAGVYLVEGGFPCQKL